MAQNMSSLDESKEQVASEFEERLADYEGAAISAPVLRQVLRDMLNRAVIIPAAAALKLQEEALAQRRAKDQAYSERNALVAVMTKVWPSHLLDHPRNLPDYDPEYPVAVCVHIPEAGQQGWHVHRDELHLFSHLKGLDIPSCPGWQPYSTQEKYQRLGQLPVLRRDAVRTALRESSGSDFHVRADLWDRGDLGCKWVKSDAFGRPVATLRRIGWLDQKGRVYVHAPGVTGFDGGSLTPLLIDVREDGH
jgi:hypothetical protein